MMARQACLKPSALPNASCPEPSWYPARPSLTNTRAGGGEGGGGGRGGARLFELHPSVIDGRAAVLYLNLETVLALSQEEKRYTPPRRFPSSAFDLSVIAGSRERIGDLLKNLVRFVPEEMLEDAEYVRQYSGPPLAENSKSVSFRITVSSADRTLSSEDVGSIRNHIIEGMRGLGYELRV